MGIPQGRVWPWCFQQPRAPRTGRGSSSCCRCGASRGGKRAPRPRRQARPWSHSPTFAGHSWHQPRGGGAQPPPAKTKPSLSPLLIAYTPRAPLGPGPRQRLLELLGGAEACFREVLFWGCNLSAAEDVYPMGVNAMWCACVPERPFSALRSCLMFALERPSRCRLLKLFACCCPRTMPSRLLPVLLLYVGGGRLRYRLVARLLPEPGVDYFLHLEPDCVPLRPRWLETVSALGAGARRALLRQRLPRGSAPAAGGRAR